jgi:hypothetical protein
MDELTTNIPDALSPPFPRKRRAFVLHRNFVNDLTLFAFLERRQWRVGPRFSLCWKI